MSNEQNPDYELIKFAAEVTRADFSERYPSKTITLSVMSNSDVLAQADAKARAKSTSSTSSKGK